MFAAMGRLVKLAVVIYLVTHGLPSAADMDLRDLASALLAQLRFGL